MEFMKLTQSVRNTCSNMKHTFSILKTWAFSLQPLTVFQLATDIWAWAKCKKESQVIAELRRQPEKQKYRHSEISNDNR